MPKLTPEEALELAKVMIADGYGEPRIYYNFAGKVYVQFEVCMDAEPKEELKAVSND